VRCDQQCGDADGRAGRAGHIYPPKGFETDGCTGPGLDWQGHPADARTTPGQAAADVRLRGVALVTDGAAGFGRAEIP
jgi:hypothetical protein